MKAAKGVTEEIKGLLLREEYSKALQIVEASGIKAAATRELGISRNTIYRYLKKD